MKATILTTKGTNLDGFGVQVPARKKTEVMEFSCIDARQASRLRKKPWKKLLIMLDISLLKIQNSSN